MSAKGNLVEKPCILVVEDELLVAQSIANKLRSAGYTVPAIAPSGLEAIEAAMQFAPDLILIDIRLADEMDGIEVIEHIQSKLDVSVVYLTAYIDQVVLDRARITGPFGYVVKPFQDRELLSTIEIALYKHKMEKRLLESEAGYRSLFQDSPISLWEEDFWAVKAYLDELRAAGISDLSAYMEQHPQVVKHCAELVKVVNVNQASVKLFHAKDKQDLVQGLDKLFVDRSLRVFKQELLALADGQARFEAEIVGRTIPGELMDTLIQVCIAPGYEKTWSKVFVSAIDVTERKRVETALRESEARYRALFDHMGDGVAIYRAVDGGRDFVFVDFNQAAENIEHIKRQDLIGKSVLEVFPQVREFGLLEVFQRVWQTGNPEHHPISLYQDNRIMGWRENFVYKLPSGEIVAVYSDQTKRKQVEAEREMLFTQVKEQSSQMQQVLETVPEGVILLDDEGRVLIANPVAQRDLEVLTAEKNPARLDSLATRPLREFLHTSQDPSWQEMRADGRIFEIMARPVSAAVKSAGWVLVIRDMTREREMQQHIRQQDRMAAIGQLAGGVAHDFNNILTAIKGYTGFVLEEIVSDDLVRADLIEIQKAADRASALTNQLLIFGRKKVTCPTVLNLNDVIVNMLKMLRRVIGEHIDLVVDLAETLEAVEVDQGQVEQVILNLVVNARDAMPEGGQLVLHTENVTLDEADKLRQSGIEPGAYVMLSVRDTGVGMDDEIQAHIFEPFFTTKEQGIGGGLGLSIVYGIVTQSEGHIAVQSEVGQGTTFFVYLPRAAQAVQTKKSQPADEKGLDGTETILLVEDEDVVRDLARRALERRGYTVLAPRLPKQALRLMQQYVGPVSLLVTDVVMPEMNGRELAAQITALRPNIRVLYISGYTDDVISTHGVLEQGIVLLPKPFGPKELVQKVRQVLDGG